MLHTSRPIDDHSKSHSRIWAIAGPAMLANISAPLVGLVDTWAIGHMPSATHLAAVGLGAVIFNYIAWAFGFLRMGTTGMVAQSHGAGDKAGLVAHMVRAAILGVVIAGLLLALQGPMWDLAMVAFLPPDEVHYQARDYFDIRIWALPFTLFIYTLNGTLIGMARTKDALKLQLVLNISNGILNVIFVIGMGMGVVGVALGTLLAEILTALVGLWMIAKALGGRAIINSFKNAVTWQIDKFTRLLNVNGFIFVRTLMLMTAWAMVMRDAAKMDDQAMAASHIGNQFVLLISLGLDGLAYAAEALTGAAYGKPCRASFRHWVKTTTFWAVTASLVYVALFYLFGSMVTALLTDIEGVRDTVGVIMPLIIALPIIAVWSYQFDGIYIGATAAGAMMVTMGLAFGLYLLVMDPMINRWGLMGLWGAVLVFLGTRGLTQAVWYFKIERGLDKR